MASLPGTEGMLKLLKRLKRLGCCYGELKIVARWHWAISPFACGELSVAFFFYLIESSKGPMTGL